MPISLKLLEEKKEATFFDATEYVGDNLYPKLDLTSNQWVIDFDKVKVDNYIIVDKATEMRVDTIARYLLGTENYVDVIVKFNKILNPFSLKEGDIILIPNLTSFFDNVKKVNYKSKNITQSVSKTLSRKSSTNTSIAVKTSGKGSKTYHKGTNGVIVF